MSDQAVADEKKEKEFGPLPKGELTFPEKVTLKRWSAEGKKFLDTREGVAACRFSGAKEQKSFYLKQKDAGGVAIRPGSEVIDADGNVYVVTDSPQSAEAHLVRVKPKP